MTLADTTALRPQQKSPSVSAGAFSGEVPYEDQNPASTASINSATMLVILIMGFTAGPAVSL